MPNHNLKLTYFDISGGRAEPARLAFTIGGIEFEDIRVPFSEWANVRESSPFHACPFLEVDGRVVGESTAIMRFAGKLANLYPEDPVQALYCDELLEAVEDMWVKLGPTMHIQDPDELKLARKELAEGPYTRFLQQFEERLKANGGKFFADNRLTVADLQVLTVCRGLASGNFDHIPTDLVATVAPEVQKHMERVLEVPAIRDHYAKLASAAT
jgi:glutathione S-transferase